ncbi:TAP-like protein [Gleimia coleocanis DSM 15436]|uniref:TAP-like protein n=1 Tax=Gleimia coleocanis DSM 15436 TaxID=525245 RepID=C0W272_9ACTO|nr:alpha/beta hydrolase [Gleimia coleocanis]EEH63286.1 TAP-like protein [Gleimia coleocanis DSM 15436]
MVTPNRKLSVSRAALASAMAAVLLLAGCGAQEVKRGSLKDVKSAEERFESKAPDAALQKFYDQEVTWKSCKDNEAVSEISEGETDLPSYTCAEIDVPLDYANPGGETIKLQLVRHSKDGSVKTPLLFNPGGPGGSAVGSLSNMANAVFTNEVQQEYDLVAVDPRGVGTSTPIKCLSDEEIDNLRAGYTLDGKPLPEDDPEFKVVKSEAEKYSQKCLENSRGISEHADTDSVVADFDIVRAALGQEKLNYFGFSYGTYIGALYADTFPQNVGYMVLDSAVDPALNIDEIAAGQAEGFEESLKHFLEKSAEDDPKFPFRGANAEEEFLKWLKGIDKKPLETSDPDRLATGAIARSGILGGLYSEDFYQFVASSITITLEDGNGTELINLADLLNDRLPDGTYLDNSFDAFNVVNNLDYAPVGDVADWQKHADELAAKYPLVGDQFGGASSALAGWKIKPKNTRRAVTGEGAAPILVVGGTHDPATPYQWSVSLAKQLKSARLITQETWSHGQYGRSAGDCLRKTIDSYLLEDKVPEKDLYCKAE